MNAVNDTEHEMLDWNHVKTSSAQVSATTKKNTPPNQNSQGNVQICEMKNTKGPVAKSLTCETFLIIKYIFAKLWLYQNVHYEKRKIISFMKIDL